MTTPITKFVQISTRLASKVVPAATFENGLFLGCDEDYLTLGTVPPDRRYLLVTKDDFADYLDEDSEEYAYALGYFAQDYTPDALLIGRTIQAATAPYTVLTGGVQTFATYTLIDDGALKFVSGEDTDTLTDLDFDGCTSFAQVLTVINEALAALEAPDIKNLENCVFFIDNLGRCCFHIPTVTGSTVPTVTLSAAGSGTDLFSNTYLGATATVTAGYDAETLSDSLQAIAELAFFYNVATFAEEGATTVEEAEYLALAQYIETQVLQFDFLTYDTDAKDVAVTDDLVSQLQDLNLDRTTCYYTERETQRPDGANAGYVFPQAAGSCSFAYNALSGVSESGLTKTLTAAEMLALDGKHVIYMCQVADVCFPFKSLTCSGEEKRLILAIDWFNATCQIDILNDRLVKKIHTYDWATFGAIESILYKNAKILSTRNALYPADDKDYPFTVTMPSPADFSAAEKKTHVFEREVFHGTVKSEILQWEISGTFEI